MPFEEVSAEDAAVELGLTAAVGGPLLLAGIADHLRQAAARWGPTARPTLAAHMKRTLAACGQWSPTASADVRAALTTLVELGELVDVGHLTVADDDEPEDEVQPEDDAAPAPRTVRRARYAAPLPRAVDFGQSTLVLGSADIASAQLVAFGAAGEHATIARWVCDPAAREALEAEAVPLTPSEWLGLPGAIDHVERRVVDHKHVDATGGLAELWASIERELSELGAPSAPTPLALLAGPPGGFFGTPDAEGGRWRPASRTPDGVWVAVKPSTRGPRPYVTRVAQGTVVAARELYDMDELHWAILARGLVEGEPERARLTVTPRGLEVALSCWMPAQARRLRAISSVDRWTWTLPPWVSADAATELIGAFGVRVGG